MRSTESILIEIGIIGGAIAIGVPAVVAMVTLLYELWAFMLGAIWDKIHDLYTMR